MTLVDDTPGAARRARGIYSLTPECPHRYEDGRSAWEQVDYEGRWGRGRRWVCALCGRGDPEGMADVAVKECLA